MFNEEPSEYECINIDLAPSHFFNDVTIIGDVRNQESLDRALAGCDAVILLAAQHRDDVHPVSLYYETNVKGAVNTLRAMEKNNIRKLIFFSSVAVYGLNKANPDENHPADPFNDYGKSKWQAEEVMRKWSARHPEWDIDIVRPTVIFGERNRGNVYNLLRQISSGRFVMVGNGNNRKSMAYVGNVVAFTRYLMQHPSPGCHVYNYVDKPDCTMNQLVSEVSKVLGRHIPAIRLPYSIGMLGGYCFDLAAWMLRRPLTISSVRVKKFCSSTECDATKAHSCGFKAPYTLREGLARTLEFEFLHPRPDDITFTTE